MNTILLRSRTLAALSFVAMSLGTAACSSESSGSSSFEGSYSGTYSGDSSGPVTMEIDGDKVDVVATVSGTKYPGSGNIQSNGNVSIGVGAGAGVTVTFSGTFASGKGSGSWQSTAGTKGSWSVSK